MNPDDDRRSGADRRRKRFIRRWPDWRNGADRRAKLRDGMSIRAVG
jgi:hypothetical protein